MPCQAYPMIDTTEHLGPLGVVAPVVIDKLGYFAGITVDPGAEINSSNRFGCVEVVIVSGRPETLGEK